MGFFASVRDVLVFLVAARVLGHGRRMEAFLVIVMGYYTVLLFARPGASAESQATFDLFWYGYGYIIKYVTGLFFFVSLLGLLFNVYAVPFSRPLRFAGALAGLVLWVSYAAKFYLIGAIATPGHAFALPAALFGEVGVMFMAIAGLPRPGAPGNLGGDV